MPYADFGVLWSDIFDPMRHMEGAVVHLAARYPLFLLSNTNPLHFEYIKRRFSQFLRPFQAFILSYEVGSRKPEAAIYQALIRGWGARAGEISTWTTSPPLWTRPGSQGLHGLAFYRPPGYSQEHLSRAGLW